MIRQFPKVLIFSSLLALIARPVAAQTDSTMFPFVIPWDDASKTATDVSFLNPAPLEEKHRIVARDGHFFDQTGRRVRFLGANFSFGANFPDKADAEKIAARLHKYGFNMVRLHHMDNRKSPEGLWDPKFPDFQHLDAGQIDKLDYFVAQLKKNGIYVDLNLHVSRRFGPADGFPDTEKLPHNGKVTVWFEPRMIELQKKFAREMLSHRNPYTNLTYAQDPAVALVEIHNEDSMIDAMRDGRIAGLPPYYKQMLVSGWNDFLAKKYGSTSALLAVWNGGKPDAAKNLISNSRFDNNTAGWSFEKNAPAQGSIETQGIQGTGVLPAGRALVLKTTAVSGTHWHLQTNFTGLDLKDKQSYTLKFWARAKEPRKATLYFKMEQAPNQDVGLRTQVALTTQWKQYELNFVAKEPIPNRSRLTFVMGEAVNEIYLADLRLSSGIELQEGQSLEAKNIDLLQPSASPWGEDITQYLMEIERVYADGMRDYIKKDLGTRGLVTCSQASYGGLGGVWRESKMDFVDMHAYWQHPDFVNGQWSSVNWSIRNTAMVSDPNYGTFSGLAMNRIAGKPFTVSEYNHPAPNSFSAETLPMIMAYAAWQDWDGVFLFDYSAGRDVYRTEKIENFFPVDSHPGKMAFMPAAAALYLRGTNNPQPTTTKTLKIPVSQVLPLTSASGNIKDAWKNAGVTSQETLNSGFKIEFVPTGNLRIESTNNKNVAQNALQWSPTNGQFSYTTPQAQVAVSRYAQSTKADLGDWSYDLSNSRNGFAALALYSIDGKPIRTSQSLLLTVGGDVENSNMGWNATRTSISDKWGVGPVQAEGIAGNISLKTANSKATVYALDSTGKRAQTVPAQWNNSELKFAIGPQFKTMWYEIAAQ